MILRDLNSFLNRLPAIATAIARYLLLQAANPSRYDELCWKQDRKMVGKIVRHRERFELQSLLV
jgi:hypothetical protein